MFDFNLHITPSVSVALVFSVAAVLLIAEKIWPAHGDQPNGRAHWYARALVINTINIIVFVGVDALLTNLTVATGLPRSLLNGDVQFSPFVGACLGYFIFTFIVYWWHRARHHYDFLWRWFHQLHHSPSRITTLTAYYIHPLDLLANLTISNVIVMLILGLNIEGAAWYTVLTGIAGFVIHTNIKLPRWVGYVFQTPEMHRLHHQSGHHAGNYSDIVWWDMMFGTYNNPRQQIDRCGFSETSEKRWLAMLSGKNIPEN